jgi:hypothetical protein
MTIFFENIFLGAGNFVRVEKSERGLVFARGERDRAGPNMDLAFPQGGARKLLSHTLEKSKTGAR